MNDAYKLTLVNDQIKTAGVNFEPFGRVYTYLTILSDLEVGDEVVVETGSDNALKVAQVVRVDEEADIPANSTLKYRWILSKAGTTARREQERLRELEKQALAILKASAKKRQKAKLREELKEFFGDDLEKVSSINFLTDDIEISEEKDTQ